MKRSLIKHKILYPYATLFAVFLLLLSLIVVIALVSFATCEYGCESQKKSLSEAVGGSENTPRVISGVVDAISTSTARLKILAGGFPPGTPFREEIKEVNIHRDVSVMKMDGVKDRKTIEKEIFVHQELLKKGSTAPVAPDFALYKAIELSDIRVGDDVGITLDNSGSTNFEAVKIILLPRRAF